MKKKVLLLLLLGALTVLSTTAMGSTLEERVATNETSISGINLLNRLQSNVILEGARGTKDVIEKNLGIKMVSATTVVGAGKIQTEAFDAVAGAVGENKNTIADLSSVVASKASVSDVNAAKDQANSAMGIAIDNTGNINNATDGMIASAGKLGITVETVEANSKYLEAGKVQAEIFDKTVDAIVKNKDNIKDMKSDVWNTAVQSSNAHANIANGMIEAGKKLGIEEDYETMNGVPVFNAEQASQASGRVFDKTVDEVVKNKDSIATNGGAIASNRDLISKNTTDLANHKEEALARDEKIEVAISDLKVTDEKVNTAIGRLEDADEKFAETDGKLLKADEDLQAADKKINKNIATLHKHDDAVYETIGVTRDGSGTEIKAVKADVNRAMINNLQRAAEDDIATNKTDIATNKAKTEENKKEIDRNTGQINQALELADNNSEYIEKNSKRIDGLEKKVDGLESKMNKGLAMAAATSSIVYPHLGKGDLGIGAGIGGYGGSQAIAIGVAMQPTENVRINTNVSTSDTSDTMYGAGVGYKFNIFGS